MSDQTPEQLADGFEDSDTFPSNPPWLPDPLPSESPLARRVADKAIEDALFGETAEGVRIGDYRLERRLGAGGMGEVFAARHVETGDRVAIKLLSTTKGTLLYRFKREFRALADISHPNLIRLHELVAPEAGPACYVMELLDGRPFVEWVRETAPIGTLPDLERLKRALRQLVEGLHEVHSHGYIHRDLKPSNVLVTSVGRVVLLDFGLVFDLSDPDGGVTWDGQLLGTPSYMAPEQASGKRVGKEADFYAIGVMLFECLTGQLPHRGSALQQLVDKQSDATPAPGIDGTGAPEWLHSLCVRLLARDPSTRPTGEELLERLGAASRSLSKPHDAFIEWKALTALHGALEQLGQSREPLIVHLRGPAGPHRAGLLRRFRTELAGGEAIVLHGCCHEDESIPHKGVDAIVDALSAWLRRLTLVERTEVCPADVAALVRLFPVLDEIWDLGEAPDIDPSSTQELGGTALAELLGRIAEKSPLVLSIDDFQWADPDSVTLLNKLISRPGSMLLLISYCQDAGQSEALRALLANDRLAGPAVHTIEISGRTAGWTSDDTLSMFVVNPSQRTAELVPNLGERVSIASCEDLVGALLHDRYRVGEILGVGGMGEVYAAEHVTIHRPVAIKALNIRFADNPQIVSRFLQEARAASMIDHPNVVDITDFGATPGGSVYFVMERLQGEDLKRLLAEAGALTWPAVHDIALDICRALRAAHAKGIIHRDLKPSNCFRVTRGDGEEIVKVVDFGIAKMLGDESSSGAILGTPAYMSPEQIRGAQVDQRSDIYSFGVLLFELLTGSRPFVRPTVTGVLMAHLFDDPPRLREQHPAIDISDEVEKLIATALAKDAGSRFETIDDMRQAIVATRTPPVRSGSSSPVFHADHTPELSASASLAIPNFRSRGRLPALAALIGVIVALAAVLTFGPALKDQPTTAQEPESTTAPPTLPAEEPPDDSLAAPAPLEPNLGAGTIGEPEPDAKASPGLEKLTQKKVKEVYNRRVSRAVQDCGRKLRVPTGTTLDIKITLAKKTGRVASVTVPGDVSPELKKCVEEVVEEKLDVGPFSWSAQSSWVVTHPF